MSPLLDVEAITGLIPINLYLQKLGGKSQLRGHSLLPNHILQSLISLCSNSYSHQHAFSLNSLTR